MIKQLNRIDKKQMFVTAGVLAALAGAANAQFVVDTVAVPERAVQTIAQPATQEVSSQTIVITSDDGKTYKVVLKNGEVENAWIGEHEVGHERAIHEADAIRFIGENGEVEQVFKLHITAPKAPRAASAPRGLSFFTQDEHPDRVAVNLDVEINAPPVMLGINLSEPGDALRAQLGLGEMQVILVDGVIDGLPASKAGLKKYDVIVSLDGSKGSSGAMLTEVLSGKVDGDPLNMIVMRAGKKIEMVAKLAAYDAKALGQENPIIYDDDARFPGATIRGWNQGDNSNDNLQVWVHGDDDELARLKETDRGQYDRMLEAREVFRMSKQAQEEMQSKIAEAMRDAERRVLELRGGQLFVREADEAAAMAAEQLANLENRFQQRLPGMERELEERLEMIEERFDAIESRFDQQIERIGARMERLTSIMERLADRLERAAEED